MCSRLSPLLSGHMFSAGLFDIEPIMCARTRHAQQPQPQGVPGAAPDGRQAVMRTNKQPGEADRQVGLSADTVGNTPAASQAFTSSQEPSSCCDRSSLTTAQGDQQQNASPHCTPHQLSLHALLLPLPETEASTFNASCLCL